MLLMAMNLFTGIACLWFAQRWRGPARTSNDHYSAVRKVSAQLYFRILVAGRGMVNFGDLA